MKQQSNTPESDLAYADAREKYMLGEDGNDWFNRCVAMLECARKLERERDEALSKLAKLGRMIEIAGNANDAKTEAEVALSATFAEAMAITDRDMIAAELEAARSRLAETWNVMCRYGCAGESLADTLKRLRGAADKACDERDQLRKVADELAALLTVLFEPMPEGSFHPDNPVGQTCYPLLNYNNLPHVIARKEKK